MAKGHFLGEFEQVALLAVARLNGDGYGVTIRKEIERRTGRAVSIGAIYATLERLVAKGHISSRSGPSTPERGGRSKRFYGLEPGGATALEASRTILDRMWEDVELRPRPEVSK